MKPGKLDEFGRGTPGKRCRGSLFVRLPGYRPGLRLQLELPAAPPIPLRAQAAADTRPSFEPIVFAFGSVVSRSTPAAPDGRCPLGRAGTCGPGSCPEHFD